MTGNERIVHPVPRMFVLAIAGIAIAMFLTLVQVAVLKAFLDAPNGVVPNGNADTLTQTSLAGSLETTPSAGQTINPLAFTEIAMRLPLGTRLLLLAFNVALICVLTFLMALWSPKFLRRLLFGTEFRRNAPGRRRKGDTELLRINSINTDPYEIIRLRQIAEQRKYGHVPVPATIRDTKPLAPPQRIIRR